MLAGAAVAVAAGADFVVEGAVDFVLFGTVMESVRCVWAWEGRGSLPEDGGEVVGHVVCLEDSST